MSWNTKKGKILEKNVKPKLKIEGNPSSSIYFYNDLIYVRIIVSDSFSYALKKCGRFFLISVFIVLSITAIL